MAKLSHVGTAARPPQSCVEPLASYKASLEKLWQQVLANGPLLSMKICQRKRSSRKKTPSDFITLAIRKTSWTLAITHKKIAKVSHLERSEFASQIGPIRWIGQKGKEQAAAAKVQLNLMKGGRII